VNPERTTLIFDLDGTLIDSMTPYTDLFCEMLHTECNVSRSISLPIYENLLGKGPKAQFAAVLRHVEAADDDRVEDLTRRYWQRAEVHEPLPFPEVLEALHALRDQGYTLIVSSGSIPSSVERKMKIAGLDHLFQIALGSHEHEAALSKGPGHFSLIAEALMTTSETLCRQAVFIGDGVYDMQVAREAGMPGIGRVTGDNGDLLLAAGANHLIHDLRELPPLLRVL
jgi:phosphoglycolate phosphatase-like HAD superfamily hydrolase